MTDPQKIHLVKNDKEVVIELVSTLVGLGILYYALNPSAMDRIQEWAQTRWDRFVHHVSVWTARQSIRSLPETDE